MSTETTMPSNLDLLTPIGNTFDQQVQAAANTGLNPLSIDTIQVNVGLRCDLACRHCHVRSSPIRTEQMDWETMELVLRAAHQTGIRTIDVTGGAPEMNPHFRRFVSQARRQGLEVTVRTNLTILLHPEYEDLPQFYQAHQVQLIASLPCYLQENVDRQRGRRTYEKSIEVIRHLNEVGYGIEPVLPLMLVYNPVDASLPPDQHALERAYRQELRLRCGIEFTRLYIITNMPIGRFLRDLERDGRAEDYLALLRDSFNPQTLDGLMCRHQLHVGWDGTMYDCDFNFALGLPIHGEHRHIRDFHPETFFRRRIRTGNHCFGCTAGCGSSCKGSLA